jgi:hypothetical protein
MTGTHETANNRDDTPTGTYIPAKTVIPTAAAADEAISKALQSNPSMRMEGNPEFTASMASAFHYIVEDMYIVKEHESCNMTTHLILCPTSVGRTTGSIRSYDPSKVIGSRGLQRKRPNYQKEVAKIHRNFLRV